MSDRAVGRPWTAYEDALLAAAVAAHGEADNWKAVALAVPGRTNKACRKASPSPRPHTRADRPQRWLHSLSPSVKKSAWTKDEDNLLLELYKIHAAKWAVIARNIPGRTDDACSKRYREALDPALKKDDWTPDEDDRLLAVYARIGGKWGRVGQELQRSGLGCRNRWRLLQRKRATASLADQGPKITPEPASFSSLCQWPLPMIAPEPYWDAPSAPPPTADVLPDPAPLAQPHLLVPFHYSSSSLSSALSSYEKDADTSASTRRQSLVLPTAPAPPDIPSPAVFAPFDYESPSSTCAASVGSTSPAPQAPFAEDMHQNNLYSDCPRQFHQLQQNVHRPALPAHAPSAPVQVDHYIPSVAHEECSLPHAALSSRRHPTPQSTSLRSTDVYFPTPRLPDQQPPRMSSSMTSVSLLDRSDSYYHAAPEPQPDVSPQHALLSPPDPLPRPGYHYVHQRDPSRARVVESLHGLDQQGEYHHNHVLPVQSRHRHPTSPSEAPYALECRNEDTPTQPDAGPSTVASDHYYSSSQLRPSQLVQRSTASPRPAPMPYTKRPSFDSSSEDARPSPSYPIPRQKIGIAAAKKRVDAQAPLRLSSDLPATSDPSIKPYACGHESCWPANAAASRAAYCTSRGLSDHNKAAHPEDAGGDRPYRCGLEGCGKSWKSINGLQYHLQISKAHFQHAITSTFVSGYIGGLAVPASVEASTSGEGEEKTRKQYKCPHENCPNRYKQLSGLRYHLAHGHPVELPKQLDFVPPALSRKLAEKMRVQGPAPPSSDCQGHSDVSNHSPRGTFDI